MPTNVKVLYGTRTDQGANFGSPALNAINSAAYSVQSNSVDVSTNGFSDLLVDLNMASSSTTPGGNLQIVLFAMSSTNGTDFTAGGVASSATESTLTLVGVLPLNGTTLNRRVFSVASAFGGVLPPYVKLVVKNDSGVITGGACTIHTQTVTVSTATT